MTDPQPLSDADLLAWSVVLAYRGLQQRRGITILLLPFPPCPTCGGVVDGALSTTVERGIEWHARLTLRPCGHIHTATDDGMHRVLAHQGDMLEAMEQADRSPFPDDRAWTTEDVIRNARDFVGAPQEAADGPESVPQASGGELAGRNGDRSPQAASSEALRERLVDSLEHYPVACWTPRNLAGRVMGVVGAELERAEEAARAAEHGRRMAVESFTVYRNDAKQLHATLAEVLDAFEAYWARTDYCGPSEAAVQPEHFRAWRDMLQPEALDARNAEAAIERVRKVIASFDGRGVITPGHVNFDIPTASEVLDKVREALDPAATQATQPQEQP